MSVINTSLARLYAPYSANMKFVGDKRPITAKRRKRPTPPPPDSEKRKLLIFDWQKRIALHEASHAVAARAYGMPVKFTEIGIDPGDPGLGRIRYGTDWVNFAGDSSAWINTVVALARPSADIVCYDSPKRIVGADTDFKHARESAPQVDPQNSHEVIRQAWTAALKIFRDNRTVISCLAAILERNGKLSGAAIDGIIGSISISGKVRPGPSRPCGGE